VQRYLLLCLLDQVPVVLWRVAVVATLAPILGVRLLSAVSETGRQTCSAVRRRRRRLISREASIAVVSHHSILSLLNVSRAASEMTTLRTVDRSVCELCSTATSVVRRRLTVDHTLEFRLDSRCTDRDVT